MNWSIRNKLILIGFLSAIALTGLQGISLYVNKQVNTSVGASDLTNNKLALVESMKRANLELILAAMDSIIDKDEGQIQPERKAVIAESLKALRENGRALADLEDDDARCVELKKRLEAKQQTPDDVLLFTMMRGYALCGDVTNAQQCMQSLGKVSGEAYAHLALAHAVNGDANGILEVAHDARSGSKPRCTSPSHSSHRFLLLLPPTHSFTHIYIQPHPQNFVHRGTGNSRTADRVPRCWRQPSTTWLRSAPPRTLRRCLRPLKSPTCVFA